MIENNLDKNLDVPDFNPDIPLPLQKVGTTGRIFPIRLKLPQTPLFVSTCNADIFAELPGSRRGIHVSRMSETILAHLERDYESPQQLALELAESIRESQISIGSTVDLSFFWTETEKTPATNLDSIQSYEIFTSAKITNNDSYLTIGVKVPGMSACPCVQLNAREYYLRMDPDNILNEILTSNIPLYSHSQRVLVTVQLMLFDIRIALKIDFRNLINIIRNTITPTFDLLKRIDEVKLVEKAHAHPQFSEDITRKLAVIISENYLGIIPEDSEIFIHVASLESIHSFNLHSELSMKLNEIRKHLG